MQEYVKQEASANAAIENANAAAEEARTTAAATATKHGKCDEGTA